LAADEQSYSIAAVERISDAGRYRKIAASQPLLLKPHGGIAAQREFELKDGP